MKNGNYVGIKNLVLIKVKIFIKSDEGKTSMDVDNEAES